MLKIKSHRNQHNFCVLSGDCTDTFNFLRKLNHMLLNSFNFIALFPFIFTLYWLIPSYEEKMALLDVIAEKKPDVVFVAMVSPKQELLMEEMQKLHAAIYQGLGGSFDVYTGSVQRAPKWWVDRNLEFAYRLIKQPSRIKRQIHLVRFLMLVFLRRI